MTGREVALSRLIGREVRDADGRKVCRLEEAIAGIELGDGTAHYVVREFRIGRYRLLDQIAGGRFSRHFLRRLGTISGYERYRVPWEWMDLADPERPRITRRIAECPIEADS